VTCQGEKRGGSPAGAELPLLTDADVAAYAAAVGDHNPLHVDPVFARRSPYGRRVAHGALAATLALSTAERVQLDAVREIEVTFRQPVLPGIRYRVDPVPAAGGFGLRTSFGDVRVLDVRCRTGSPPPVSSPRASVPLTIPIPGEARVLDPAALARIGSEEGSYAADAVGLAGLLARFSAREIPPHLAVLLAWASYWTGMCVPGRDALLIGVTAKVHSASAGVVGFRTRPPAADLRTGLTTVRAELSGGVGAEVTLQSVLRRQIPAAAPDEMAALLPPSPRLAGRTLLVVGGGRGLGAAIATGLAGQGATVLVGCIGSTERLDRALRDYGDRLKPVTADAGEPAALAAAISAVLADEPLDGLVLTAGPAIPAMPVAAQAVEPAIDFITASLRLVLCPVTTAGPRLRRGSPVVITSSQAVADPPRHWPHYVAAKTAVEGFAAYLAAHHPWRILVTRPARLRTDLTNTPLGHPAAAPVAPTAAAVVEAIVTAIQSADPLPRKVTFV